MITPKAVTPRKLEKERKKTPQKHYILKPHLTDRPFKGDARLADLKSRLEHPAGKELKK